MRMIGRLVGSFVAVIALLVAQALSTSSAVQAQAPLPAAAAADAAPREDISRLETGLPLLRSFRPKDYSAAAQNWAIVQDPRGVIYVGNHNGVLEFDGQRWRLIRVANNTAVRSLALDARGRIYVGAVGEVGHLVPDAHGQLQYASLLDRVPPEARDFADVYQAFATPQGLVFSSMRRLMRLQGDKFESWTPAAAFRRTYRVGNRLLIHEPGRGLLELLDGRLHLLPGSERYADESIYAMLPVESTAQTAPPGILIGTRSHGFFVLDANGPTTWPTDIDAELKRDLLYNAIRLPDGRLALGTLQGGLYLIDAQGKRLSQLRKADGLPTDAITALSPDREAGLWIATDNGLARAEVGSPLSRFDERNGLAGATYAVHRHQGQLYVATVHGVFRLLPGAAARFERVPGVDSQTWAFLSVGEELLVANHQGVYELAGESATLISAFDQATSLHASLAQPGRVFVGGRAGLAALRRAEGGWLDEGPVPGVDVDVHTMMEDRSGRLWLGTDGAGFLRVHLPAAADEGPQSQMRIERFGIAEGLPSLNDSRVYAIDGEPRFATHAGIYRFNDAQHHFDPDPRFAGLFAQPRAVLHFDETEQGLWLFAYDPAGTWNATGLAARQANGRYRWEANPLSALAGMPIDAIWHDTNGVVWFGGDEGLFRYDPRIAKDYEQTFPALLRRVTTRADYVLFSGGGEPTPASLAYTDNALRFDYAAPSFDGVDAVRFQVRLVGSDTDWSDWSAETYKDYNHLFEGHYRFQVRARNLHGTLSSEAEYGFRVLPPWYRTLWAYLGYFLALIGSGWAALHWRLRRVQAQKRALEATVAERTRTLRESLDANDALLSELKCKSALLERQSREDALTGLANRREFDERLQLEVQRAERYGESFALVLVDIDHFKRVNDRYGHAGGDNVLRLLAATMRGHARGSDLQARIGGEEFAWLLPGQDAAGAAKAAELLRAEVAAQNCSATDPDLAVTLSAGVASWYPGCGADTMLRRADDALYQSKAAGRDQVSVAASVT